MIKILFQILTQLKHLDQLLQPALELAPVLGLHMQPFNKRNNSVKKLFMIEKFT